MTSEVSNKTIVPIWKGPRLRAILFSLEQGLDSDRYPVAFHAAYGDVKEVRLIIVKAGVDIQQWPHEIWQLTGILPSYAGSSYHLSRDAEPLWPTVEFSVRERAGAVTFDKDILMNLMDKMRNHHGIID